MSRLSSIRTLGAIALSLAASYAAHPTTPGCGTHGERTREELYLHRQSQKALARQAGLKPRAASPANAARDAGDIAIIDDSDGVIARRNAFNLTHRTVTFTPTVADASRYRVTTDVDSYDATIADAGQKLDTLGDDDSREIALPFAFPFYGSAYRSVFVNSDGNVTFGGKFQLTERSLGILLGGLPQIAGLFTDLDPTSARGKGGVYVTADTWRFVVTWVGVPLYSEYGYGTPETFQVRMYADGTVELAYLDVSSSVNAAVGISPGGGKGTLSLISLAASNGGEFSGPVADRFAGTEEVDIAAAAQKFYQTHEDAYDYLVFLNAVGVPAGDGVVAYEVTVRNNRTGYGDQIVDAGADFGSKRRLQAVMNMGPLYQYPEDPASVVSARGTTGDTGVTVLAHEAGHLFLAFVSVRDDDDPEARPMLGRALAHWAFNFNSEASVLEGNRIQDNGQSLSRRFETVATVQGYAPLDQYLMGFRAPEEVPPTFVVEQATVTASRAPQVGVTFNGQRRNVTVDDIIAVEGRRTPDHTVAQRRFRFGFVLIGAAGSDVPAETIAKVERYRAAFEKFYGAAASDRASADISLKKAVQLSLAPAGGVLLNGAGSASIALDRAAAAPVTFLLASGGGGVQVPASVVVPVGASRVAFTIRGVREGVDQLTATSSDSSYEAAVARVQVLSGVRGLSVSGRVDAGAVVARVTDVNELPYSGVRVIERNTGAGVATDENGEARFNVGNAALVVEGSSAAPVVVKVPVKPSVAANGVVNGASFAPGITPGAFATVFGTALAGERVQVLINGVAAPVAYAGDSQINFVVPDALTGATARVEVANAVGVSAPMQTAVKPVSPGVFVVDAARQGAVLIAGTAQTTFMRPAKAGDYLEIYCTGLGVGALAPEATIGGVNAQVLGAVASTQYPGLNQINVVVPRGVPAGDQALVVRQDGVASNEALVRVQ